MTQSINSFDLTPNEHIALDNMTEKLQLLKMLDNVNVDIKEALELVQTITQSEGMTVEEVIKFLSESLFMDPEVSPDGMTFKANDVHDI